MHKKPLVLFLVGPTAIGKTGLSIPLAEKLRAEIISCDSMQVYKGMDILSSKPGLRERRSVPHHLLSLVSPEKEFNVSEYRSRALAALEDIIRRGKVPLFVGGSGLYMSVMVDGIFEKKTEDVQVRGRLFDRAQAEGSAVLHLQLQKVDPAAAGRIHPNDTKRIVRALEVFQVTGVPISALQRTRKGLGDAYDVRIIGLDMERDALYQRINERVEEMFRSGLVTEVQKLLKKRLSRTAACAIGIPEIKGYLDGAWDIARAAALLQQNSRHYARRQMTWFRKDKRIHWVSVSPEMSEEMVLASVRALL